MAISFVIFQGIRTNVAKKPYIFVGFQGVCVCVGGGGSGLPAPPPSRENLDSFNTLDDEILLVFAVIAFFSCRSCMTNFISKDAGSTVAQW